MSKENCLATEKRRVEKKYYALQSQDLDENSDVEDMESIPEAIDLHWMECLERAARNLVWWDMNTFPLKDTRKAVELYAYGDKDKMDSSLWDELVRGGGTYTHVPSTGPDGEDACFNRLFEDMAISTLYHPLPSNYVIISGDDRFDAIAGYLAGDHFEIHLAWGSYSDNILPHRQWIWKDIASRKRIKHIKRIKHY